MFAPNKSSSTLGSFCCLLTGFQGNKFHPLSTAFKDRECGLVVPDVNLSRNKTEIWAARPMAVSPFVFFSRCFLFMHRFTDLLKTLSRTWFIHAVLLSPKQSMNKITASKFMTSLLFFYFSHCSWMQCSELKICGVFLCYRCKLSFSHN